RCGRAPRAHAPRAESRVPRPRRSPRRALARGAEARRLHDARRPRALSPRHIGHATATAGNGCAPPLGSRAMADSVFVLDGDLVVPTDLARGPWTPEAQHGGVPAALLARSVERCEGGDAMVVARVTVELVRRVPIAPLRLDARLTRPGKKVQIVECSLAVAETGVEVARATGVRLRRGHV